MIVVIDETGRLAVVEAEDFKRFSVKVQTSEASFAAIAAETSDAVRFDGPATAWVDVDFLKSMPEFQAAAQRVAFDAMVVGAARYGWVSDDQKAIKSHVIWQG